MSMNVFKAKKGAQVIFTGDGGYDGDNKYARSVLEVGKQYTIEKVEIYQSSTDVWVEGFKGSFNSEHFTNVIKDRGSDYEQLLELTSKKFADKIKQLIEQQNQIREVIQYRVRIDRNGLTDEEAAESPEEDAPIVVVDLLTGWNGETHALWTYWFQTHTKRFGWNVINHSWIERFQALEAGAAELPELGLYAYPPETDEGE